MLSLIDIKDVQHLGKGFASRISIMSGSVENKMVGRNRIGIIEDRKVRMIRVRCGSWSYFTRAKYCK